ncbi:Hypothetical predicted protein [Podarcis lilfordi]|uniref:Uncharacterized protein n=1 Tax=Podarcis lilfordi TaxID=74358 RepID=A0AA35LFS6_9SAUR|nr:Hypothetical predicted protein [Podarcis lilfordi]
MWCWEKTQSRGLFLLSTFEELIIIGRTSAYDTPDAYEALASQMEKVSNAQDEAVTQQEGVQGSSVVPPHCPLFIPTKILISLSHPTA